MKSCKKARRRAGSAGAHARPLHVAQLWRIWDGGGGRLGRLCLGGGASMAGPRLRRSRRAARTVAACRAARRGESTEQVRYEAEPCTVRAARRRDVLQ
jgi:hypothetical protein